MEKIIDSLHRGNPIFIQGAMDSEISHLLHSLDDYHEEDLYGFSFFAGTHQKYPVIVSKPTRA